MGAERGKRERKKKKTCPWPPLFSTRFERTEGGKKEKESLKDRVDRKRKRVRLFYYLRLTERKGKKDLKGNK